MRDPGIRTCSGTSWAAWAICACATCWACAESAVANVNNDAEPIRVASLDVVGFIVIPPCQRRPFYVIGIPARLISGAPAHQIGLHFPLKAVVTRLRLETHRTLSYGRCLMLMLLKAPRVFASPLNS